MSLFLDGGDEPDFDQIDEYLRAHFGARAVYVFELENIEWVQQMHNGQPECPSCHGYRDEGHKRNCKLDALIEGGSR